MTWVTFVVSVPTENCSLQHSLYTFSVTPIPHRSLLQTGLHGTMWPYFVYGMPSTPQLQSSQAPSCGTKCKSMHAATRWHWFIYHEFYTSDETNKIVGFKELFEGTFQLVRLLPPPGYEKHSRYLYPYCFYLRIDTPGTYKAAIAGPRTIQNLRGWREGIWCCVWDGIVGMHCGHPLWQCQLWQDIESTCHRIHVIVFVHAPYYHYRTLRKLYVITLRLRTLRRGFVKLLPRTAVVYKGVSPVHFQVFDSFSFEGDSLTCNIFEVYDRAPTLHGGCGSSCGWWFCWIQVMDNGSWDVKTKHSTKHYNEGWVAVSFFIYAVRDKNTLLELTYKGAETNHTYLGFAKGGGQACALWLPNKYAVEPIWVWWLF